jgi:hypothetical protein
VIKADFPVGGALVEIMTGFCVTPEKEKPGTKAPVFWMQAR